MIDNISLIQWNARGLTKARLEEFRNFLSLQNPSVVMLNETFWNNKTNIKFKNYQIIKKDRTDRPGGGVAMLIHSSIQFKTLEICPSRNLETVGISIKTTSHGPVDIITSYCPLGNCEKEEFQLLTNRRNDFILGEDFNAHHELWEPDRRRNKSGKSIYSTMLEDPDLTLLTPPNLATYICPSSSKPSTIDLTFTSPNIALDSLINTGPPLGSDHIPILIDTRLTPKDPYSGVPRWIFEDKKWPQWNSEINSKLVQADILNCRDPSKCYDTIYQAIINASKLVFRLSNPSKQKNREPEKPLWTEECKSAAEETRKALKEWRLDSFSTEKRIRWKKCEA